jgi:hypothetical protein
MSTRIPDIRGGSLILGETDNELLKIRLNEPVDFGGERNTVVLTPESVEKLIEELTKWSKTKRNPRSQSSGEVCSSSTSKPIEQCAKPPTPPTKQ